ncbi:uncharacterized protein LOC129887324 isoform X3 [Solanum dulcamara]|uniref:uncharacterized protein LOC129887324 isoform X3 n=1 Tax=Solanum dulcamara TaxID=45834 RepID=UPI0024850E89|nr:uncharacterized protein LOC129887324 isoform X3 [Solanum dulcamara]
MAVSRSKQLFYPWNHLMLQLIESLSGSMAVRIKHGKTCTSMDMLYNGEPQRICNIAGTTDATSGFFKQGNPRYVVRSSLILPPRMLDSLGR